MRLMFITTLVTFLLDQATKYLVVIAMDLRTFHTIDVLPPFLNFRMAWNRGVNFGLFSGNGDTTKWVLIAIAVGVSLWVTIWVWRSGASRWAMIAAGLLVGGALGNAIDRVIYGAVADFLNMSCCGWDNPFAFNVADITIFAGAIGLILFTSEKSDGDDPDQIS